MNLDAAGYESKAVYDGETVMHILDGGWDLAILDLMLPGRDGMSLIRPLKENGILSICLTAKGDVVSKVQGLKLGAEDYMVKPFEVLELLVRMEKVLERTGKMKRQMEFGSMTVDLITHRVYENEKEIHLRPMEFQLLTVFLKK